MKNYELILHHIQNSVSLSRGDILEALKTLFYENDNLQAKFCMGMILYGLSVRKPTNEELLGLVDFVKYVEPSIFNNKYKLPVADPIIGLAGSGKKGVKTFNISTLAAIVASSAGCFVSKAVSKSVSSITGSSDILSNAGANIDISFDLMTKVFQETGLGVFQIERTIPKFDTFYGGTFLVPHALSYALAAIINPVECNSIVYGFAGKNIDISSKTLNQIGYNKGLIVSSTDDKILYIDELTPLTYNNISYIDTLKTDENIDVSEIFGCEKCVPNDLKSSTNIEGQLGIFNLCLSGKASIAQTNAIALNAALIIKEAKIEKDYKASFNVAKDIILSGASLKKFNLFKEMTNDLGAR